MQPLLLALAFLLELVAFAAFACLPLLFHLNRFIHVVTGIALLIMLITFWSLYMAPRASKKFSPPAYYVSKALIYAVCAVVIFAKYGTIYGLTFVTAVALDDAMLFRHNLEK